MSLTIRLAEAADLDQLADVERAAARKFHLEWTGKSSPYDNTLPRDMLEVSLAQDALWLAVEGGVTVGFLAARPLAGALHIYEVSVAYAHQGLGHGRNLLMAAIDDAGRRKLAAVTLTTDRAIPWNAPFYARLGFVETTLAECSADLAAIVSFEKSHATIPGNRIAMRLELPILSL